MITRETYREHPALNQSLFKEYLKSPAHYQREKHRQDLIALGVVEDTPTQPMQLGTALHACLLEFKAFGVDVIKKPDCRSSEGQALFEANKANRIIQLEKAYWESYCAVQPTLTAQGRLGPYLDTMLHPDTNRETPYEFVIDVAGEKVPAKCLIDMDRPSGGMLWDVKTTSKSERDFVWTLRTDVAIQLAWYREALRQHGFDPTDIRVIKIDTKELLHSAEYTFNPYDLDSVWMCIVLPKLAELLEMRRQNPQHWPTAAELNPQPIQPWLPQL